MGSSENHHIVLWKSLIEGESAGVGPLMMGSLRNSTVQERLPAAQGDRSCSTTTNRFLAGQGFKKLFGTYKVTCGPWTGQYRPRLCSLTNAIP